MASMHAQLLGPFRRTYVYLQRSAHEQPAIFYSIVLGLVGPVAVLVVPAVRKNYLGWTPIERPPTSYPVPARARDASLAGYEDGWKPATV